MSAAIIEANIPAYPDTLSPSFMYDLSRKKEFPRLGRLEPPRAADTPAGTLLPHQEMFRRFMSPHTQYTSCLVFHAMGLGKTCTSIAVAENFRMSYGKPRPKALVFVKSDDMVRHYRKEIATVCTSGNYIPKLEEGEGDTEGKMTKQMYRVRLNKAVSKSYDIVSWETFFKRELTDDIIKQEYSRRVIIVDEAHHLTPTINPGSEEAKAAGGLYRNMHHFLHTVSQCRIFLLTGTPIWDQANEIGSLMNLIIREQVPTGTAFNQAYFEGETLVNQAQLRKLWKGKVSYLRPTASLATRIEEGMVEPWAKHVKVIPLQFSPFQAKTVRKIWDPDEADKEEVEGDTLLKGSRESSNFVFPDGTYGTAGFIKHCTHKVTTAKRKKGGGEATLVQKVVYTLDQTTIAALSDNGKPSIAKLRTYSTKFATIIEDILAHPTELCFVYGESVAGSGAILFGLILQMFGHKLALTDAAAKGPGKKYAIVTSDANTTNDSVAIESLLEVFNSPENMHGKHVQVLIGTRKISEGFTLKNVRRGYVFMPHWNLPAIDQALGRILRFGSHDALPEDERNVRVFRYLSVFDLDDPSDVSPDMHVFHIAESKEYRNTQVYRLLKEVAWDCVLNYKRNVVAEDVPDTRECDYMDNCNYTCEGYPLDHITVGKAPGEVSEYRLGPEDDTTYNLFYATGEVDELHRKIIHAFSDTHAIHLYRLSDLLGHPARGALLAALDQLIDDRVPIRHSADGTPIYLKEEGNVYYLDTSISFDSRYADAIYTAVPRTTKHVPLEFIIEGYLMAEDIPAVQTFCHVPTKANLEKVSFRSRIVLVEYAYAARAKNLYNKKLKALNSINLLLIIYDKDIYVLPDGKAVHLLYTEEYGGMSYNVVAKGLKPTGKMRVFSDGVWSTATLAEEDKYIAEVKKLTERKKEEVRETFAGIYGTISSKDGHFRIVRPPTGKGRVCGTLKREDLLKTTIDLGAMPDPDDEEVTIDALRKFEHIAAFEPLPDDPDILNQIKQLLSMTNKGLCEFLKGWMENADLLRDE